jgi:hypothetical protein
MEVLDNIQARSAEPGDLIRFQAWSDDDTYTELMVVTFVHDAGTFVRLAGWSEVSGDTVVHELDPYLEVELMGA